jgi:hypothetical protein
LDGFWFNDKLFKGNDVTDQESDVLNFIIDMITYNNVSQKDHDEGDQGKVKALNKLEQITENLNA